MIADGTEHFVGPLFNIPGCLGQGRSTPGGGKFYAVILGRVVAGREVDPSGRFAPQNFERDDWCRRIPFTQEGGNTRPSQNACRLTGKPLPHETGIAADDNAFLVLSGSGQIVGNCLDDDFNIVIGEVFSKNSSPPGCSKGNTRHVYRLLNKKTSFVVLE